MYILSDLKDFSTKLQYYQAECQLQHADQCENQSGF
jgi:hypothetical protein